MYLVVTMLQPFSHIIEGYHPVLKVLQWCEKTGVPRQAELVLLHGGMGVGVGVRSLERCGALLALCYITSCPLDPQRTPRRVKKT